MLSQVSTYCNDDLDYDVPFIKLVDDTKVESVRAILINNEKGSAWSGRIECVYTINLSVPLHFMFRDFERRNSFVGEEEIDNALNLKYVCKYNQEDITSSVKKPIELGMKDGDKIEIYVEGIPPPIDVNFIDEYGNITTLQARPCVKLYRLFEDYGLQNKMPLLISRLMCEYRYNGESLSNHNRLKSLKDVFTGGTITKITIYVKVVFKLERVGQIQQFILTNCKSFIQNIPPRKLINQRLDSGRIIEYSNNGKNEIWTVGINDSNGSVQKVHLSKSELIGALESYYTYNNRGVIYDLLEYVQNKLVVYIGRMQIIADEYHLKSTRQGLLVDARNMALLKVLELEIERQKISSIADWLWTKFKRSTLAQMDGSLNNLLWTVQKFKSEVRSVTSKVNKPILRPGDLVYAYGKDIGPTWEKGIVKSSREYADDIDGYGPHRVYGVELGNGELHEDIEDYQVIPKEDYLVSCSIKESKWKGVRHVYDKDSSDRWAREAGWYTVRIDGIEEPFVNLSGALRVYDILQAQTRKDNLSKLSK